MAAAETAAAMNVTPGLRILAPEQRAGGQVLPLTWAQMYP
jgi:hypothetical protein